MAMAQLYDTEGDVFLEVQVPRDREVPSIVPEWIYLSSDGAVQGCASWKAQPKEATEKQRVFQCAGWIMSGTLRYNEVQEISEEAPEPEVVYVPPMEQAPLPFDLPQEAITHG